MGRVTDSVVKGVREHLIERLFESQSASERDSRSGLAIQHANFRWAYSNDWDVTARNGNALGEKKSSSSEWVCQQSISVCLFDPDNPELGFGIGHAAHAAPLEPIINSNVRELEEIDMLLKIASFRAAQDYDFQKHRRIRTPWVKPQTLGVTPNVNFEDVRRGKRRQKAWEAGYFPLDKIVRNLSGQVRDLDPEWETIAGSYARARVYNAHVRQVVVEISPDKLDSRILNKRSLTTKMINKWDQFGVVSLYAQFLREGIPDQVVRTHAPLIFPKDINLRTLKAANFNPFIEQVDRFRFAEDLEPGTYLTLFQPPAGSTYFHEALYGHGISADLLIDELVSSIVGVDQNVSEYPFDVYVFGGQTRADGGYGTAVYDDEGTPTKEVKVISRSKLKNFLHSRRSAAAFGVEPMGNMRMEYGSARNAFEEFLRPFSAATLATVPEPRTSFIHIEASAEEAYTLEKLRMKARSIARRSGRFSKYIEVFDINGGYVDTSQGTWFGSDPLLLLHDVRKRTTTPVRGVDIRGTSLGSLSGIVGLSDEFEDVFGLCGSTSGEISETVRIPYTLVDNVAFVKHLEVIPAIPFPPSEDLDGDYKKSNRMHVVL